MKLAFLLVPLIVGGCAQLTVSTIGSSSTSVRADLAATCEGAANCRFINSPVQVDRNQRRMISSRKVPFYPTLAQLDFVDGGEATWIAPKGIVTDGASIPPIFVPIIGAPTSPEFVNAAAVHDAYCGIGNEQGAKFQSKPWQQVHIMFYDALLVGGVPELKAKLMFAAVWLGGPRWGVVEFQPAQQPTAPMQAAMRRTKLYVEENNPSIPALIAFIAGQQAGVRRAVAQAGPGGGGGGDTGNGEAEGESNAPSTDGTEGDTGSDPGTATDRPGSVGETDANSPGASASDPSGSDGY
ncbi:DUF1353 domain-containing protein [Rhodobacteraceae bacterium KMM 6894]|nr:DUF1353 domain-containing protein [Rhodobacteraceae bacterium KMM 6894]